MAHVLANDLRAAVLQAAIQGNLTTQKDSDSDVYELISNAAKAMSSNEIDGRKVKKKNLSNNIINHEFDIPDNWAWVQLGSICVIARGGSPRPIKSYLTNDESGVNWIKIGDTEKNGKYISSTKEKIIPEGVKKSRYVKAGDFLLTNSMSFGRPYILKIDGCIHDGWLVISQPYEVFIPDYLYYLLSSAFAYKQFCGLTSGAVVQNLNGDKVANAFFPLPPIEEQARIVAKVDEIMAKIDEYEKSEKKLEKLEKEFPEDMKASLLQAAMQGKLTEQHPEEDGYAIDLLNQIQEEKKHLVKEGKIKKQPKTKPIMEDEIPFDIPDNWEWVNVKILFNIFNGDRGKNYPAKSKLSKKGIPFISALNLNGKTVVKDNNLLCLSDEQYDKLRAGKLEQNDIVICLRGSLGKHGRYPFKKGAIA